ncbi:UbiA family prenyltransferase [Nocardioides sp. LHG3406-4]|uniref:UbiA family prenyltransferase n=1 Tax=Nocardioides sp. LHG3406-4 TaxID=2804575 RepID=UPI003CF5C0DC
MSASVTTRTTRGPGSAAALLRAAHPGPSIAVSAMAGALGVAGQLDAGRTALVVAAVLTGQLSIGWSNDLIDRERDRRVGRRDKPLASGELAAATVRLACGLSLAATVVLSLGCGVGAGLLHLALVAAGWVYNLGVKSTALSWLPYAVAFGGLPVFVALVEPGAGPPPVWVPIAGALLGVGAHLVNALPDLADDEATGVRGLPHRIGARWTPAVAVAVLAAATAVIAAGTSPVSPAVSVPALLVVAALSVTALVTRGRTPFRAVIAIALVDVALLVVSR